MNFSKKVNYYVKILFWKLECLLDKNKNKIFKLLDGSKFKYPINTALGQQLYANNFEIEELKFFISSLKLDDIVFDVGANGGIYAIIAAKIVGSRGHIYAFEPDFKMSQLLEENIKLNNLLNVTVSSEAVSDRSGIAKFALSEDSAMNSFIQTEHAGQKIKKWEEVHTTTLDEVVNLHKLSRVNFVKIDVEGAEKLVLQGSSNLLSSSNPPVFMFEAADTTSSGFGYSALDLLQYFSDLGYRILAVDDNIGTIEMPISINKNTDIKYCNFVATKAPLNKL
jgi:FkbM family methyltransferase